MTVDAPAPRVSAAARAAALWGVATAPLSALAGLLFWSARTAEGRLAAVAALLVLVAGGLALARRMRAAGVALSLVAVALAALVARAPDGSAPAGARVRTVFLRGDGPSRIAPTQLVPEGDQLRLGTHLVWLADPFMSRARAARLRAVLDREYAGIEADPGMRALGSAMGDVVTDRDTGRLFVYEPEHAPGERRPAVIFLHGSFGSWQVFFQGQRRWAARRRMAVVAPSFGFGDWHHPGGLDAVARARQWLIEQPWVDPGQIYLVCLSNGGRAVTRIMAREPARYAGLIFISAVIETDVIEGGQSELGWQRVPVLVLHGGRDERIGRPWADEAVAVMRRRWMDVRYAVLPGEDHFLILTARDAMEREIERFLDEVEHPAR